MKENKPKENKNKSNQRKIKTNDLRFLTRINKNNSHIRPRMKSTNVSVELEAAELGYKNCSSNQARTRIKATEGSSKFQLFLRPFVLLPRSITGAGRRATSNDILHGKREGKEKETSRISFSSPDDKAMEIARAVRSVGLDFAGKMVQSRSNCTPTTRGKIHWRQKKSEKQKEKNKQYPLWGGGCSRGFS